MTAQPGTNLRVNGDRLWDMLMEMAKIGPGVAGGNNRQTLTDEDAEGRRLFQHWCEDAGLTMGVDTMGNMFMTRPGTDPDALPVHVGSHLDTQPTGGKYDGVLGVLAGLEVIRSMNDLNIKTRHPIVVTNWTNEEGARFAPAMLASGVFAGVLTQDYAYARKDMDGKTFGDELKRIGWLGDLGGHLPTEPGLLQTCRAALRHFTAAGCTVEEAVPQFDFERLWRAWIDLRSFSVAGANAALYNDPAKRALLKPEAVWEIERGLALPAMAVYDAARVRSAWYETLRRLFDSYDFLVLPSAQVFPFDAALDWPHAVDGREMDTYHRWMQTVVPATMAGLPALAAPAGFGPQGLPAGLQIIGPAQADLAVLQIGHAYDQASGLSRVRSPLLD